MSFFVAAWPIIKRLLPFIGGALVLLGAVLWLRHWGNGREADGFHRRDAEVAGLVASIEKQNAAIEQLRQVSAGAAVEVEAATQRAQEARKATAALSQRLKAAGRVAGPCKVAAVNAEAWEAVK